MTRALLVTIATPGFLDPARQLFASAHDAGRWQGDYMLLAYGITPEDRHWFESRGIAVHEYDYLVSEAEWEKLRPPEKPIRHMHRVVMEKCRLFETGFRAWDTVVYMDADMIVTGPITRLAQVSAFSATWDLCAFLKHNVTDAAILTAHGYDPESYAFCSGMFAFPTRILLPDTAQQLLALAHNMLPHAYFNDQAILNLYFHKQWRRLSMAYAFLVTAMPHTPLCRPGAALALHFANHARPWESASPYHALWRQNLQNADALDFKTPQPLTSALRLKALWREIFFIPWLFWLSAHITNRYATKPWYPRLHHTYTALARRLGISPQAARYTPHTPQ